MASVELEQDVAMYTKDSAGKLSLQFPVTRWGLVEDGADVKSAPASGDYVPVFDGADGGKAKKVTWEAVRSGAAVTLSSSVKSTSTTEAATPYAVKQVNDKVTDLATQVGSCNKVFYATSDASFMTAAIEATCEDDFALTAGVVVFVFFKNKNMALDPTLNVNGTGAIPIKQWPHSMRPCISLGAAGAIVEFIYSGTDWYIIAGTQADVNAYGATTLTNSLNYYDDEGKTIAASAYAVGELNEKLAALETRLAALEQPGTA